METQFNNLRYEADWKKLCLHLLRVTCWTEAVDEDGSIRTNILEEAFGNEYQSAATLLLQSLTPLRFAFMDGQSRMASLYYYERKLIPRDYGSDLAMSSAVGLHLEELSQRWSLAPTGDLARCSIYLPSANSFGENVSRSYLTRMRTVSKKYMHDIRNKKEILDSMVPSNLNDCIIEMIDRYNNGEETVNAHTIVESLKAAFDYVILSIRKFDPWLQQKFFHPDDVKALAKLSDEDFVTKVMKIIYKAGTKIIYPKVTGNQAKSPSSQLMVLMLVLGTALVDASSRKALESCINNDWIVHISSMDCKYKLTADGLHEGTFVDGSVGDGAGFKSQFYLVSWMHIRDMYA
jgi:hypothetical protein